MKLLFFALLLTLCGAGAQAADIYIGGNTEIGGWVFKRITPPEYNVQVGDRLIWQWTSFHTVVTLPNRQAYDECDVSQSTQLADTDQPEGGGFRHQYILTVRQTTCPGGTCYFSCNVGNGIHCDGGMKVIVRVRSASDNGGGSGPATPPPVQPPTTPVPPTNANFPTEPAAGLNSFSNRLVASPGVTENYFGDFNGIFDSATGRLRYIINHNVQGATNAHIHLGRAGEDGPVIDTLADVSSGSTTGEFLVTGEDLARLVQTGLYCNVHSSKYPNSAIRGQLQLSGNFVQLTLTGDEEVPPVQTSSTGEFTGIWSADSQLFYYALRHDVGDVTTAHIHEGDVGSDGAPIATLNVAPAGTSSYGVLSMTATQVAALLTKGLYVNVHSTTFPGGILRTQIVLRGNSFHSQMSGAQENPPTPGGGGEGDFYGVWDGSTATLYYAINHDQSDVQAGHLHMGNVGENGSVQHRLTVATRGMSYGQVNFERDQVASLLSGGLYANLHSARFSDGVMRGQINLSGNSFQITLTGAQEVPPVVSAATATFTGLWDGETHELSFALQHTLQDATAGHLHSGGRGIDGPVVANLKLSNSGATAGIIDLQGSDVVGLLNGGMYINLHSSSNPGGELRGQVQLSGNRMNIALSGSEEVPPVFTRNSGQFVAIYSPTGNSLSYGIAHDLLDAEAAHIHVGQRGVDGPPIAVLRFGRFGPEGGHIHMTEDDVAALIQDGLYVNIHSTSVKGGHLRGQLGLTGTSFRVNLSGGEEVPPVGETATGALLATFHQPSSTLYYSLQHSIADGATAAHIHRGAVGQEGEPVDVLAVAQDGAGTRNGHWLMSPTDISLLNRQELYCNVHSERFPGGALRGQLRLFGGPTGPAAPVPVVQPPPTTTTPPTPPPPSSSSSNNNATPIQFQQCPAGQCFCRSAATSNYAGWCSTSAQQCSTLGAAFSAFCGTEPPRQFVPISARFPLAHLYGWYDFVTQTWRAYSTSFGGNFGFGF